MISTIEWKRCGVDPLPNEVGDRILVLWWYKDHWNADRRRMSICELTEFHGWRDEEGDISCPEAEGEFWADERDITRFMPEVE